MSAPSGPDPWTSDRMVPERPNVPHHPFKLQISLPTDLKASHIQRIAVPLSDVANSTKVVSRALSEVGFGVVQRWTLTMSHGSQDRSYPKGTEMILFERHVRVDATQNELGRKRARLYFIGVVASVAAFALLDLTVPDFLYWVIPVAGILSVFLILALVSFGTSVFASDVVTAAFPPHSDPGTGLTRTSDLGAKGIIELAGAYALSKNYSAKGGSFRVVSRTVESSGVRGAIDSAASQIRGGREIK